MTFAAPLFLLAALAGIIPPLLHMINRRRAKELPFSTLRFLRISVQKTRRRKQVHDVFLMLVRTAVLLLIALALAKPTVTSLGSLLGVGARSAVAIILDNSASMGMIDQGRPRFQTATASVGQILDELHEGDEVALLPTDGPALVDQNTLDHTQEKARQMLAQCRVSYERADLTAKLREARKLLADSAAANKQIYVITDGQALSWKGLATGEGTQSVPLSLRERAGVRGTADDAANGSRPEDTGSPHPNPLPKGEGTIGGPLPKGEGTGETPRSIGEAADDPETLTIPIIVVDCNRAPKPNVAVHSVVLDAEVPLVGMPMKATVGLWNTSAVSQQPVVELYIDGSKVASSAALNMPAEERVTHDFRFSVDHGGLHRGEVRLKGSDGSAYDDRRFFTIQVDEAIPVAVVKPQHHEIPALEDSFYLEQALALGGAENGAVETTPLAAADLLGEPLQKYKVIFCINLPAPSAAAAERLKNYVEHGGNLVWVCGDGVKPEAYNQMNQQVGGTLLPAPLVDLRSPTPGADRDSWHLNFLDSKHPALRHLVEPVSLYESVLVYQHIRIDAAARASESRVLARLDDGEPLLLERAVGRGKVLLLGTSAQPGWTNLPLRPIFLPLVARLTFYLAAGEHAREEVVAGSPLLLRLEDETQPLGIEVLTPSGEMLRLKTHDAPGGKGQVFRYADTHETGIYVLRPMQSAQAGPIAYAVNADPDEADPAKIDRQELLTRFGRTPLIFADDPDDLSSTFTLLREGKSLCGPFLLAVLVALVFETLVSNRLSR